MTLTCPHCGRAIECYTSGQQPENGETNICWSCRQPSVFFIGALGVSLRRPTAGEQVEIAADPQYRRARKAMAAMAETHDPLREPIVLTRWRP